MPNPEFVEPRLGNPGVVEILYNDFGPEWINRINEALGEPLDILSPHGGQELATYYFPVGDRENEGKEPYSMITVTRHITPQDPYFKLHVRDLGEELEDVKFYPQIAAFAVDPEMKWVDFFAFEAVGGRPVHVARANSIGEVDYFRDPSELFSP